MAVTVNSQKVFNSGTKRMEITSITFTAPDTATTYSSRLNAIDHLSIHSELNADVLADVTGRSVAVSAVTNPDTVSFFAVGR